MMGENPRAIFAILAVVLVIIVGTIILTIFSERKTLLPPIDPRYKKSELSHEERIEDLLSYMTLEEKVAQMALVDKNSIHDIADIETYGIGALLSGAGAKPENNTQDGWSDMVNRFDKEARKSRLGIPLLYGVDANHGHANVPGAVIFPHLIGLGATGNTNLIEEVAAATAEELNATGIHWSFSPTLDLPEDIRWGRVYEAFGSDPNVVGQLGRAYVRGLQGRDAPGSISVLATPKHYIGLGSMLWNTSGNENFKIDQGITAPDDSKLRDVYLPPFKDAVEAGAMSIMVGLNSWGETKLSANSYLIADVLKGELGFQGFVVSDWYGVYEIPGGDYHAAVTAINAGIDLVMLPFDYETFIRNVSRAVKTGDIQESRIDDAVRRILRAKFALGLFDSESGNNNLSSFGTDEHRKVAQKAVAESVVLLKDENILPIRVSMDHIRIAGSAADNVGRQSGAWTIEWQGVDGNWLGGTSILKGIQALAPANTVIEYKKDGLFEEETKADLGIAIVGESPYAEGWGDNGNPNISLPDLSVIERLRKSSDKVLVILVTGRPLFISDEISKWDALMVAWLPGTEGQGVADTLFGKMPFTGKLPLYWPASNSQLPVTHDGKTRDGTEVLFIRGFGLR